MDFYILDNANESGITGNVYPQVANYQNWCADNYDYLVTELTPYRLPDKEFSLDYLELDNKAILTDFISVYNPIWGFIISDKARLVFETCKLPLHKYFNVILKNSEHVYSNYYWLYMVSENSSKIDFNTSTFKLMKGHLPIQVGEKAFSSIEELIEFQKLNSRVRVVPNRINIRFNEINTDIFKLGQVNFDWIVTTAFVDKLIDKNIVGYVVKKINWLYVV